MRNRVVIENVFPEINKGKAFVKRVINGGVVVSADIYADGHDIIRASVLYKHESEKQWSEVPMELLENDRWKARFITASRGFYQFTLTAWIDHLMTWYEGFLKKHEAGQDMALELKIGANHLRETAKLYTKAKAKGITDAADTLDSGKDNAAISFVLGEEMKKLVHDFPLKQHVTEYDNNLRVRVGRHKELYSTWYELFPRSTSETPGKHGTFKDVERLLPRISEMGFDVLYMPPIHPIGKLNRKGKNNATTALPGEPGSPWAIGSDEGGHKSVHAELGTIADYKHLVKTAREKFDIEVALDLAFQCAPDHPYVKEHPEWFTWRPDKTIAYAENPPKRYEDIVPINFECAQWKDLWAELKSVIAFWIENGILIFRVDNPHTKPIPFWEWVIGEIHKEYPDVIFLSESFTRPKVMNSLAKVGFTQSYTYFTWRNTKAQMEEYMGELTTGEIRQYFRANFWPNTPDILPYELMNAGYSAFALRVALAATLSSNYGLYGPSYEFMENTGNTNGKEEYYNSEKYEIRHYDWNHKNQLTELISTINHIRKDNPALQSTFNIQFTRTDNDNLMSFVKKSDSLNNIIWCVANFDVHNNQAGWLEVPKQFLGIERRVNLKVQDLLTGEVYYWFNEWNFVELNPSKFPMHIFKIEVR